MVSPPSDLLEFRALFEAQYAYACRALRRLGIRDGDVNDVAQELFLQLHDDFALFDRERPFRPWLYAYAVRLAANYRRLARHKASEISEGERDTKVPTSERRAIRDLVARALERLPDDQRDVIVMHDFEGFTAPEIAEATKAPLNTVYSRIRLGREGFRKSVTELRGDAQ